MSAKTNLATLLIAATAITSNSAALANDLTDNIINDLYNFKIIADKSDIRPNNNITRAEAVKMICIAEGNDVFDMTQQILKFSTMFLQVIGLQNI